MHEQREYLKRATDLSSLALSALLISSNWGRNFLISTLFTLDSPTAEEQSNSETSLFLKLTLELYHLMSMCEDARSSSGLSVIGFIGLFFEMFFIDSRFCFFYCALSEQFEAFSMHSSDKFSFKLI